MSKSQTYNTGKFIAIILVVFAHCSRMYTKMGVVTPILSSGFLAHLTEYIYSFHMPLFFMISGCIFALCIERGKYADKMAFVIKRLKRLLLPYWVFGLFYVAPIMVLFHFTSENYLSYVINGIFFSLNSRHLWFILALFWINILAIFTKPLYGKHQTFLLLLLFSLVLCLISNYFPFEFRLSSSAYYQFFFFSGMAFNKYYAAIEKRLPLKPLFFILFGAVLMMQFYYDSFLLKICYAVIGSFMVLIICMVLSKYTLPTYISNIVKNSYGIYLFHPMIIYVLFYDTYSLKILPILLCVAIFMISFGLSYFLTWIIRKLKIGIIIGE